MEYSYISDENYITVQGFMITKLGLKGSELLLYALIYGFTQDGETEFSGSLKYMCEWTNSSKPTVMNALNNLVQKGYIEKRAEKINGVIFNRYKVSWGVVKNLYWGSKNFTGGQETLPNNIDIIYNTNNNSNTCINNNNSCNSINTNYNNNTCIYPNNTQIDNINTDIKEKNCEKSKKKRYGEYQHVLLSDDEYQRLCKDYTKSVADTYIQTVDEYCELKGAKYKNYCLAVRNFIKRDNKQPIKPQHNPDEYDLTSLFEV